LEEVALTIVKIADPRLSYVKRPGWRWKWFDALSIAIHWTAEMHDLSRKEGIDLIAESLIL
jgi:hypothetical protein